MLTLLVVILVCLVMVMLVGDVKKKENWRQTLFPLSEGDEVVVGAPLGLTQWSTKIISTCHRSQKILSPKKSKTNRPTQFGQLVHFGKSVKINLGSPPPYMHDMGVFFSFKNATKSIWAAPPPNAMAKRKGVFFFSGKSSLISINC